MSAPRRILLFAYFFPPLGGAGVQRVVKLAKLLPRLGWLPTIVTVRARDYWMMDASLQAEIGPEVRVVRTASWTGLSLLRRLAPRAAGHGAGARSGRGHALARRAAAWALVPDSYVGWVPFASRAGRRLLAERRYDCLMTTSSPDSAHLIGLSLARRAGVPWVADFRDPWTRRLSFAPPTRWHRARHASLEARVLREAALVTVTSEETRADFLAHHAALPPGRIAVVTNGYDEEDFVAHAGERPPRSPLEILHAGQLNPERPARPFLEGLRLFLTRRPGAREEIRARFIGPCYESDRAAAVEMGLADRVVFEPGRAHGEIVRALLRSHVLLLMEQDSERGGLILPGKVFEYLRARRPVLALVPPGAAWSLIERLGAGRCCRTGDAEGCAAALADFHDAYRAGRLGETGLGAEDLAPFERGALARRFTELLETRLAAPPE